MFIDAVYVQVCGFDLLEDDAVTDGHVMDPVDPPPAGWTYAGNPAFDYYCYYIYANLVSLNHLRRYRRRCFSAGHILDMNLRRLQLTDWLIDWLIDRFLL